MTKKKAANASKFRMKAAATRPGRPPAVPSKPSSLNGHARKADKTLCHFPRLPKKLRLREKLLEVPPKKIAAMTAADTIRLVHNLQVHQIEIEMQNDELRRTQLELEMARERLSLPYDAAPVGFLTLDAGGVIRETNLAAARLLNVSRDALTGVKLSRFIAPESQDAFFLHRQGVFISGATQICELEMVSLNGVRFDARLETVVDRTWPVGLERCLMILTDVTERKYAEESLRRSQQQLKLVLQGAKIGLWNWNLRTDKVDYSREWKSQLGYEENEIRDGLDEWQKRLHPDDFAPTLAMHRQFISRPWPDFEVEFRLRHKDGSWHWILSRAALLRDADGAAARMMGIHVDVTARKQAEEALRQSRDELEQRVQERTAELTRANAALRAEIIERKRAERALQARESQLHSFVQQAPAAIAMFDQQMNYLAVSERWTTDYNRGHSDIIGRNHYEVHPELPERWKEIHRKGLAGESQSSDEDLWLQADGTKLWWRWSVNPWLDAAGKIGGILILAENISARKNAEESLRLFQTLVDQSSDTLEVIDPATGRFLDVNKNGPAELGCTREEYLSLRVMDIDPTMTEANWPHLMEKIRDHGPQRGEGFHQRKDGTAFPIEFSAKWVRLDRDYIMTVVRDITERRRTEERIAQLNRVQQILADIDRAIVRTPDRQQLLDEVCRVAVHRGGFKLAWIGMASPDGAIQPVAMAGATRYLEGIRVVTQDVPEGRGPVGTAFREKRAVVIDDIHGTASMSPWRDRALQFGLKYVAAFPIRIAGKMAGVFTVYAPKAGLFDEKEISLVTQVSDEISHALTAISDLDARKAAEEALRRNEHNLSVFFNQAPIGLVWLSASGTILRANLAQLELLGYSAENYVGQSFLQFSVEPAQGLELLKRLAARETVRNFPMTQRCHDGTIRHVLVDANSFWSGNQFQYSSIFLRDISDRIELERAILQVSEREHRHIAQDLHDGLGQLLAGTAYLAGTLRQKLAAKSLPEARELGRILEVINEAISQTRNLARGLHPVEPESNGLMVALQTLAARTKKLFHVRCQLHCPQPVLIRDNAVATHLFRIAQEAITNAIKHGKPGRVEINLTEIPGRICLSIKNNGTGMAVPGRKKTGMGLHIMRYRAGMIGGSLDIQKEAGGTNVVCTVHLAPDKVETGAKINKD